MSNFDEKLIERLKRLEREVERLQVKERPVVIADHGNLTGLGDDDHTQYVKGAGTVADNAIVRYDGTDGRTIQGSSVIVDDSGSAGVPGVVYAQQNTNARVAIGDESTNGSVAIGKPSGSSGRTPVIDFYANGTSYADARIIASLGSASANFGGNLDLYAANIITHGILQDNNGVQYGRPVFLTTPKTSTSWDGDGYSTVGRTKIDLSSVFGVPDGIKAVLLSVKVRDSASQTSDTYIVLGPTNVAGQGVAVNPQYTNDRYNRVVVVVPCDSNGDIYYDITASGTGTFDVIMQVFGYWL